jgi:SAM-dependent methyltransferase
MFDVQFLNVLRSAEIDQIASVFTPGSRILEIGAGTGIQALKLRQAGFDVAAVDISSSHYAAHMVFPVEHYDGKRLPFADATFDIVFSSNVLEHIADLPAMHAEMRRVLKPGGISVHLMPTHAWRLWTTLSGYPTAPVCFIINLPQLLPRGFSVSERRRLAGVLRATARGIAIGVLPLRHGERGNILSELLTFHPAWWRRNFQENGYALIKDAPVGLFYTGHMLFGPRLGLAKRKRLARYLGSGSHMFIARPNA